VRSERAAEVVGRIYYVLLKELPPPAEDSRAYSKERGAGPKSVIFDLADSQWIGDATGDEVGEALASQDDDTLSMVAGRAVARVASRPTCVAV
jgi:hypothetical protein